MRNNIFIIIATIFTFSFFGNTAGAVTDFNVLTVYKDFAIQNPSKNWPDCKLDEIPKFSQQINSFTRLNNVTNAYEFNTNTKFSLDRIFAAAVSSCKTSGVSAVVPSPAPSPVAPPSAPIKSEPLVGVLRNMDGPKQEAHCTGINCPGAGSSASNQNSGTAASGKPAFATSAPVVIPKRSVEEHANAAGGITTTTINEKGKVIFATDDKGNAIKKTYNSDGSLKGEVAKLIQADGTSLKANVDLLPEKLRNEVKDSVESSTNEATNSNLPSAQEKKAQEKIATDNEAIAKLENEIEMLEKNIQIIYINTVHFNENHEFLTNLITEVKTQFAKAKNEQEKCNSSSSKANFLCPMATSPQIQTATLLMTGLNSIIPTISSAKDTCAVTSKVNLIGQAVVGVGTIICGTSKTSCENKCSAAAIQFKSISDNLILISQSLGRAKLISDEKYKVAQSEELAATEPPLRDAALLRMGQFELISKNIETTSKVVPSLDGAVLNFQKADSNLLVQCKKYEIEIRQMATTVANMSAAAVQAKACEKQLSALDSKNNSGQILTMDEMCSQPANANSSTCKCRGDNTVVGCPGYISGAGKDGVFNKDLSNKGNSQLAGFGSHNKITPTSGSGIDSGLDGLGDEAKKALAANGDPAKDQSLVTPAGAANAGSSGSTAAGPGAAGLDKGKIVEEPKSLSSSFINAVGSLFKGAGGGRAASVDKTDKYTSDAYKEKIKRQIAAEQLRSEVSSASGVDNWSKIKMRYKSTSSSLIESN